MTELTKEDLWQAWRESANKESSMSYMTELEERTQREIFEEWYRMNYE